MMGIFDQWGGVKAPPAPSPDEYNNTLQEMAKSQADISPLMQGYGQGMTATEIHMKKQAAMNQMVQQAQMSAELQKMYKDPKQLSFTLREISNGYMVKVGDSETYVKDLNDVGGVIVARWAAKILGE